MFISEIIEHNSYIVLCVWINMFAARVNWGIRCYRLQLFSIFLKKEEENYRT